MNIEYTFANPFVELAVFDGIVFAKYKPGVVIDLKAAHVLVDDRKKVSNYQMMPLFIDGTEVQKVTKEARNYFATPEGAELISAAAIYTTSSFTKILANFLISVNLVKQYTTVKAFDNKTKAIEWLSKHKK